MSNLPVAVIAVLLDPELEERVSAATRARPILFGTQQEATLPKIADAEGLLISNMVRVDAELFDAAPKLRVVSGVGVGYDNTDVAEATRRGIAICNTPGVLTGAVADLTMAAILMLSKRLLEHVEYVRSGAWSRSEPPPPLGNDVRDKLLGIIGYGRIGREVARRAQAFGMRTCFYDLFSKAPEGAPECDYLSLDDLLQEADFVTLHGDLNPSSRHMISARELELMKPSAYLINTARGPAINQVALTDALKTNQIAGAALDVYEVEPVAEDDELIRLPNVIPFGHIGTATEETRRAMRSMAVDNLLAVLAGEPPPAIVNPEVLQVRG